jgi:hypothetical protein
MGFWATAKGAAGARASERARASGRARGGSLRAAAAPSRPFGGGAGARPRPALDARVCARALLTSIARGRTGLATTATGADEEALLLQGCCCARAAKRIVCCGGAGVLMKRLIGGGSSPANSTGVS